MNFKPEFFPANWDGTGEKDDWDVKKSQYLIQQARGFLVALEQEMIAVKNYSYPMNELIYTLFEGLKDLENRWIKERLKVETLIERGVRTFFTKEQAVMFDTVMEFYSNVIKHKRQEMFLKDVELTLIKGIVTLVILDENVWDEMIECQNEPAKFFEILGHISDDHPSNFYFKKLKDFPPTILDTVGIEAVQTVLCSCNNKKMRGENNNG
jgi:hypothetical protein